MKKTRCVEQNGDVSSIMHYAATALHKGVKQRALSPTFKNGPQHAFSNEVLPKNAPEFGDLEWPWGAGGGGNAPGSSTGLGLLRTTPG